MAWSTEIMFILLLLRDHLTYKTTKRGGLFREVPLYLKNWVNIMAADDQATLSRLVIRSHDVDVWQFKKS